MIKIGNLTFLVKAYCFPAVAGEGEGGVIVRHLRTNLNHCHKIFKHEENYSIAFKSEKSFKNYLTGSFRDVLENRH